MLKRRIIPKLQIATRSTFRGVRPVLVVTEGFRERRPIGDAISQAKIYEAQMVDELVLVDIDRTEQSWSMLVQVVGQIAEELATPLAVGGGVRRLSQVQELLDSGADKVIFNSGVLDRPELVGKVAAKYGEQCVVVSIDVRSSSNEQWVVWADSGQTDTSRDVIDWAREVTDRGAGELMITSIERDGSGRGLDLPLIESVVGSVGVPVIASGGCGLANHFVEGFLVGASGVAAGTFFSRRDQNPMQCRSQVRNAGIPIRVGF